MTFNADVLGDRRRREGEEDEDVGGRGFGMMEALVMGAVEQGGGGGGERGMQNVRCEHHSRLC